MLCPKSFKSSKNVSKNPSLSKTLTSGKNEYILPVVWPGIIQCHTRQYYHFKKQEEEDPFKQRPKD